MVRDGHAHLLGGVAETNELRPVRHGQHRDRRRRVEQHRLRFEQSHPRHLPKRIPHDQGLRAGIQDLSLRFPQPRGRGGFHEILTAVLYEHSSLEVSFRDRPLCERGTGRFNIDNHLWTKLLSPYKRCCLVYLVDKEELAHISTFLQKEEIPILLLSEYEIPDDTELPETVTAVQVEFSEQKVFENDSIEQNFPRLFLYANTFETILRILNPSKVVCLTSSKTYQKELLLGFAKDLNTKIECW